MRVLSIASLALATAIALSVGACSPYQPDLGYVPFQCGSSAPACPDGYACTGNDGNGHMTCVSLSQKMPDAGSGFNPMCANDSSVEGPNRNDMIASAFALPNPLPNNGTMKLSALAICPMGDLDNYSLIINANHEIKADLTYEAWGAPLSGSILNSSGQPIVNMSPVSGMDRTLTADAQSLPQGQYYIKIYGPTSAPSMNNYALTVTVNPFP